MNALRHPPSAAWKSLKVAVFAASLWPFAALVAGAFGLAGFDLGANPVEALIHGTGIWALNFLLITLAVTPLRRLSGWNWLIRFRRMLGLFAFFYASMHFTAYAVIDQRLDLGVIVEDILQRPFITIGMLGLLLLLPLAVTSTRGMVRRLGRHWQRLHRLVYVIAPLGVWHFYWQEKQDVREPLVYAAMLAALLLFRVIRRRRVVTRDRSQSPRAVVPVATAVRDRMTTSFSARSAGSSGMKPRSAR